MLVNYLDIDPEELADLENFDWMVKAIAQGYKTGKKISKKLGAGMEFSQYRPYSQGDDLRRMDWKMYARSDRYYIKESETETQLEVTFILDTSLSMNYGENKRSKFQFAKMLIGILSQMSLRSGDSVGLAAGGFQVAGQDEKAWKRFIYELQERRNTPGFVAPTIIGKHRKELFVIMTDHFDHNQDIPSFISELKTKRNEVIICHLLGEKESTLSFDAGDRFQDLENNQIVAFDSSKKTAYQQRLKMWTQGLHSYYLEKGIDFLTLDFSTAFSTIIQSIQNHRKSLL